MTLPRPLTFGETLDTAFTLYRRHPLTFFVAALLGGVPLTVASLALRDQIVVAPGATPGGAGLFALFATMAVAMPVQWAALTRLASQAYTGGRTTVGDAYAHGLRAWLPLVGVGIVAGVAMTVLVFALAMGVGIAIAVAGGGVGSESVGMIMTLGVITLVLMVGVYLGAFALLFAVAPAIVVERKGPLAAIGRSLSLAKGAMGRVVGVLVVGWLIVMLPSVAVAILTGTGAAMIDPAAAGALSPRQYLVQQLCAMLTWALTVPFLAASLTILYYDRRVRTEAHDLEGLVEGMTTAAAG